MQFCVTMLYLLQLTFPYGDFLFESSYPNIYLMRLKEGCNPMIKGSKASCTELGSFFPDWFLFLEE